MVVIGPASVVVRLDVKIGVGVSVNVSPIVVTVVGAVTDGRVAVFVPMITTPEFEIIVCPSGNTVVMGPWGVVELVVDPDELVGVLVIEGVRTNVWPIVVIVVGEVTEGKVAVFVPIMTTPELEIIVWPSGKTVVRGG